VSGPSGLRRFVPQAPTEPAEATGTSAPPAAAPTGAPGPAPSRPAPAGAETAGTGPAAPAFPPEVGEIIAARKQGAGSAPAAEEKCEMCAADIPADHGHVADLDKSSLLCTCRSCYLLFTQSQAGRGRWRAVPDRYARDPDAPMTAAEWDALEIPVGLAFFLRSSGRDEVAGFYPSPAGATECRLDLAAWERLSDAHPLLRAMEADVEAALICKTDDGIEHFLVPIDACYELAGRMRLYWRGFDGGTEARQSIAEFLDRVRSQAKPLGQGA
jgi:Family of unknown function (DUF5947)